MGTEDQEIGLPVFEFCAMSPRPIVGSGDDMPVSTIVHGHCMKENQTPHSFPIKYIKQCRLSDGLFTLRLRLPSIDTRCLEWRLRISRVFRVICCYVRVVSPQLTEGTNFLSKTRIWISIPSPPCLSAQFWTVLLRHSSRGISHGVSAQLRCRARTSDMISLK